MNFTRIELKNITTFIKPKAFSYSIGLLGCCLIDASVVNIGAIILKDITDGGIVGDKKLIAKAAGLLILAAVVLCILSPLFNYLFSKSVKRIMANIRLEAFYHMERMPIEYFEKKHNGDILSKFINNIGIMENLYSNSIRNIGTLIITGIYSATIMFILNWRIGVLLIFLGMVIGVINKGASKKLRAINDEIIEKENNLLKCGIDLLQGFKEIKMLNISERITNKYQNINNEAIRTSQKWYVKFGFLDSINFLLSWISNIIVFFICGILVLDGVGTVGGLLAMVLMGGNITKLFKELGNQIARMQASLAGAEGILELLNEKLEDNKNLVNNEVVDGNGITLNNIFFGYKNNENIINNLNLNFHRGKFTSLIGPSGSGKSTIFKLLLGLYPVSEGSIIIDGKNISKYTLDELREMIAYVPQEAYLFEASIEDNIRYGRIEASQKEIVRAAKLAKAHDFILLQVDGYNTLVGERGLSLSGGQRQRIAIARAILKDAPILLLDEATASLDNETDLLVQEALKTMIKGKTTIAITHRGSTINISDIVYEIVGGQARCCINNNKLFGDNIC